jgi:hypothetical protein
MNPIFPATPYTGPFLPAGWAATPVIPAQADPTARQYLETDNWLYNARARNWASYLSYIQNKKQFEEQRVLVLEQQWSQYYQHLAQLKAQDEERQRQEDEAQMETYLKEIEEERLWQDYTEALREQDADLREQAAEDKAEEWHQAAEDFAKKTGFETLHDAKDARRERRRVARQEKRRYLAASKQASSYINECFEKAKGPLEPEVSRAENYNADKPSRNFRYISADKRKGQKFQERRRFGSGWAKQHE